MNTPAKPTVTTVATINNQAIVVIEENGIKYVAVKSICDALGIASNKQIEKIKSHPILSSVETLRVSTGSDNKQYEMSTLPLKYVFGWLFTINPNNVSTEAKELLTKYQAECYDVLYREFFEKTEFYSEKEREKYRLEAEMVIAKMKVSRLKELCTEVENVKFDAWLSDKRQLKLNFDTLED